MEVFVITILVVCIIIAAIAAILIYSGLLTEIRISTGEPQIKRTTISYKFGTGPYKNVGPVFCELQEVAPKNKYIGIYYDDPKTVRK